MSSKRDPCQAKLASKMRQLRAWATNCFADAGGSVWGSKNYLAVVASGSISQFVDTSGSFFRPGNSGLWRGLAFGSACLNANRERRPLLPKPVREPDYEIF